MRTGKNFVVVFVTAPNLKTARTVAKAALEARLIACANLLPKIESHYWWQGKIESASEVLVLMKTTQRLLAKLELLILSKHPYQTPEILAISPVFGSADYLAWVQDSVHEGYFGRVRRVAVPRRD